MRTDEPTLRPRSSRPSPPVRQSGLSRARREWLSAVAPSYGFRREAQLEFGIHDPKQLVMTEWPPAGAGRGPVLVSVVAHRRELGTSTSPTPVRPVTVWHDARGHSRRVQGTERALTRFTYGPPPPSACGRARRRCSCPHDSWGNLLILIQSGSGVVGYGRVLVV